jgi:cell division cycle protein 20 (cofactor of APC complex)
MSFQAPAVNENAHPFAHDLLRMNKVGEIVERPDLSVASKMLRKVPTAPFRILDAPDIVDDYYLNLISWSRDNILAVALAQSVYLWNAANGEIHHLVTLEGSSDYVTSIGWCKMAGHSKYIAVGTNSSLTLLFDGSTLRKVRTLPGHTSRVSSIAWNQHWLSTGSRDSLILNHDIRSAESVVAKYTGHTQEVCGLKWNEEGTCLASGGNENYLCLWDASMSGSETTTTTTSRNGAVGRVLSDAAPRLVLRSHRAAVKALDWCPFHRGLLASGGGTSDRTIKFWNSSSGAMLNSVDTGSQVCSIIWSKHQRELCSSHGYSENQLILWKYPTMTRIQELPGHTARVLNMEPSPDGTSVVSAAADETLRFWNVFGPPETGKAPPLTVGALNTPMIR